MLIVILYLVEACNLPSSSINKAILQSWYSQTKDLADTIGTVPEVPCTVGHV